MVRQMRRYKGLQVASEAFLTIRSFTLAMAARLTYTKRHIQVRNAVGASSASLYVDAMRRYFQHWRMRSKWQIRKRMLQPFAMHCWRMLIRRKLIRDLGALAILRQQ